MATLNIVFNRGNNEPNVLSKSRDILGNLYYYSSVTIRVIESA
jgi:hypothetical protein